MSLQPLFPDATAEDFFDAAAEALAAEGYFILANALPPTLGEGLLARCLSLEEGAFRRAGIGRERDFQLNRFVRSDRIRWLDRRDAAEAAYLQWMERLRLALNRRLFLGLFDYECHFTRYGKGAFYKRHVDAFRGNTNRVLSTVAYLNPGWQSADGGELLIYEGDAAEPLVKVMPLYGTLVLFLSDRFPHEVLPVARERYSVAGWFRVNGSVAETVDPPVGGGAVREYVR